MLTVLSHSCDNGPCPTFYKTEGGVVVQGFKTLDPSHRPAGIPDSEDVLFIPAAAWDKLIANLPGQP